MARVLVYTAPGSGHAYPPVATALALRDRGHEVIFRTASDSVRAIERLGLAAAPIDPRIEAIPLEDWKTRTSIGALVSACDTFAKRARYEVPYLLSHPGFHGDLERRTFRPPVRRTSANASPEEVPRRVERARRPPRS
jgi:hypothetical protein